MPVGLDETAQQLVRPVIDEALLPAGEHNRAFMLLTRTMLREEAWPTAPVGRDFDGRSVDTFRPANRER